MIPQCQQFYKEFDGSIESSAVASSPPTSGATTNRQTQAMFEIFDFETAHEMFTETPPAYFLAMAHAVWQHASIGQLSHIPQLLKEQVPSERAELWILALRVVSKKNRHALDLISIP